MNPAANHHKERVSQRSTQCRRAADGGEQGTHAEQGADGEKQAFQVDPLHLGQPRWRCTGGGRRRFPQLGESITARLGAACQRFASLPGEGGQLDQRQGASEGVKSDATQGCVYRPLSSDNEGRGDE